MRCRLLSLLMLFALLANSAFAQTAVPAGIPWAGTVRDGLKQALINQKQILLYFYAPDLPACSKCEEQVLTKAEVQKAITANFIPVKVNVREVPATAKFYQANDETQLPRVLILSADDKVVSGFTASAIPAEFLAQLKTGVNTAPANPKLDQIGSLAKTASSYLAPTAEPTAKANANLAANTAADKPGSGVTPTAWQTGVTGAGGNGLLLPNFAPSNTAATPATTTSASAYGPALNSPAPTATTPAANKGSLLPAAVGPLARTSNEAINFSGAANTVPAATATTPAIPSLANYGLQGVTAPPATTVAAPAGYGLQNVVPNMAAAAQPYQQQAQQTMTQWQNSANQTLVNTQAQVNQSVTTAQQNVTTAQQNVQNQIGAAANKLSAAAPAVGSFYDTGLSARPSETKNAGLATVPGMGGTPTAASTVQPQLGVMPYGMNVGAAIPTYQQPAPAQTSIAAAAPAPAPTNYAMAPGASYSIPNNAPPTPALPGHPKEKAGLANYSTEYLQGYLGNGAKPVLPSAQVNGTKPMYSGTPSGAAVIGQVPVGNGSIANAPAAAPPTGSIAQAAPAAALAVPEISLQGNCPVTIAEAGKWTKGDPQFGAVHRGKTYLFASAAEQQKFLAAPDKYSPVLGGNDPVVMYHEGRYVAGSAVYGAMYKKRMYLFSTPAAKAEFATNPTKYEQAVFMAETQAGIIVR